MENKKIDNFCHLHLHSTFSFVDGFGLPQKYIEKAIELGQPAIAVTDHGNVSSHFKWYKYANKAGIKPILGCEMYAIDDYENRDPEDKYQHITVLTLNNKGYKNLLKLVTKSWLEGFYYKPRITYKDLEENQEGLLFTTGCPSGRFGKMHKSRVDEKEIIKQLKEFSKKFENFYIEISPWSYEEGQNYLEFLLKAHKQTKIPLLATNDCHYIEKHQNEIQDILLCIQSNDKMANSKRWKFDQRDLYLKSRKEMENSFKELFPDFDYTEALDNTIKVAEQVDFTFPTATPMKFPMKEKEKIDYFKQLVKDGFKKRGFTTKQKEYVERTKYETKLIINKGFVDYFLIVADMINWAKQNHVLVGPARGSAAGSIVCYLLGITEVDSIKHNLMFERFIDINREDIPDIDVDFEDNKRKLVKEYLVSKYGKDKVGDLATFGTFKGKMCISDIARVFQIPFTISDKLKSLIIERSGGDSRASLTIEDTLNNPNFDFPKKAVADYPALKYAIQLEGQCRNLSKHAAGVVISNEPLTDFCAIYKSGNEKVISLDGGDTKGVGLLKIDVLGINSLTAIQKAVDLIKERKGKEIDLYNLDLEDPKVYKNFQDKSKLFGIFQFEGQSVNQVCRQLKPKCFAELADINALSRPGPLNSGATTIYLNRKNGKEGMEKTHPLMKDITKDTWGIVVYQEQVMRTMREIGKMSWKDTAEIRMNISRSRGIEAFNKYKEVFSVGAKENGLSEKEINDIWSAMCTFGSWAFNKSHSVSYTIISYWSMFLKTYYPMEYFVAMCSTVHNEDKVYRIIKEYKREGYKLLPIDINKSKETFTIEEKGLRIGFLQIKGIGHKTAENIVKNQPYESLEDFEKKSKVIKPKKIIIKKSSKQKRLFI